MKHDNIEGENFIIDLIKGVKGMTQCEHGSNGLCNFHVKTNLFFKNFHSSFWPFNIEYHNSFFSPPKVL